MAFPNVKQIKTNKKNLKNKKHKKTLNIAGILLQNADHPIGLILVNTVI